MDLGSSLQRSLEAAGKNKQAVARAAWLDKAIALFAGFEETGRPYPGNQPL